MTFLVTARFRIGKDPNLLPPFMGFGVPVAPAVPALKVDDELDLSNVQAGPFRLRHVNPPEPTDPMARRLFRISSHLYFDV